MTARDIQKALLWERWRRNMCIPNYAPRGWYECDVFELTKAGLFVEYEIKLTVSDFKAEGRKQKSWTVKDGHYSPGGPRKLEQLAASDPAGPSRFFYVYPEGLLAEKDIPSWAGALICREHPPTGRVFVTCLRAAPQLHRAKIGDQVRRHAESICYWRFLTLFLSRLSR